MSREINRANLGINAAVIALTASAIVYVFTNFVTIAEFQSVTVELLYDQYYKTIERINTAQKAGERNYEAELKQRLEKLRAKICEVEPEWERCKE